MIITVTPNPALDLTYTLDQLVLGSSHRVADVRASGGGKGINVASVLHCLGFDALVTGLLGGPTGQSIADDLVARGIPTGDFVWLDEDSRRTVNVLADGVSTMLNEAGPVVPAADWLRLADAVAGLTAGGRDVLVVSGSLPRGVGERGYAELLAAAAPGTFTILDAGGPALAAACAGSPCLVKPNRAELTAATGATDLLDGIRQLRELGADQVLVSDGPNGLIHADADHAIRARLDTVLAGNPTGAGDAVTAAVAAARDCGWSREQLLRTAVAWSAAAVRHPLAGQVDPAHVPDLLDHVIIEELA